MWSTSSNRLGSTWMELLQVQQVKLSRVLIAIRNFAVISARCCFAKALAVSLLSSVLINSTTQVLTIVYIRLIFGVYYNQFKGVFIWTK